MFPTPADVLKVLLRQQEGDDPEIQALSLRTLIDSPALSIIALAWLELSWLFAWWVSGWTWIFVFIAVDCCLFKGRWRQLKYVSLIEHDREAPSAARLVSLNLGLIFLVACEIFTLTQISAAQGAILALCLALGFGGYIVAFFGAFPVLATLNIVMITAALALGLVTGSSDLMRPFGLLALPGALIFWLMIQRTHVTLLEAIRNQQHNRRLAMHDPLTKLPNRIALRAALDRHLLRIGRDEASTGVAVLCLDLDGFKQVNDRFGHSAGDWVLVHVSEILRRALVGDEIACRIGGDEYVVLLPNADEARVRAFSRFVINAVAQPFDVGRSAPVRIGVSIGAAIARDAACTAEDVIEEADVALYESKRKGRGRLSFKGMDTPSAGLSAGRQGHRQLSSGAAGASALVLPMR